MGLIKRKTREPAAPAVSKQPSTPEPAGDTVHTGGNNYGKQLSDNQIAAGKHRKRVGGHWDAIGKLQFDFLVERGLRPHHRLLDVGCGALRGGLHFVQYLDPGNYYGIDVNESLLRAGLEHEIPNAGLTDRLPATNLRQTDDFSCDDFGVDFDFLVSVSVFSHLPLNHIRLCLHQVAKATKPEARYLATFFETSEDVPFDQPVRQKQGTGRLTFPDRDPFHYRPADLEWAAAIGPWKFNYVGDWNHPRDQKMAEFIRV